MEKYIECHNCQNQYDCERTYLGGCTDGKEWEDDKDINVRSKKILANRVYSDTTLKSWKKEDLIEQIRILEHNWACAEENLNNSAKNSEKIFYEQKAEIERLTEEKWKVQDDLDNYHDMYNEEVKKNAELQKQVDELTEKLQCPMDITEAVKPFVNEAVKDTAKEILQIVKEKDYDYLWSLERVIKEYYGVEVE